MNNNETVYTAGDFVVIDHPGAGGYQGVVCTVTAPNKVNVKLAPVSAEGPAVQVPRSFLRYATDAERAAAQAAAASAPPPLRLGSVVTVCGRGGRYAVIDLPGGKRRRYRVAPVGGTEDNDYVDAERSSLTLIPRDSLPVEFLTH